jgi:hypothetical protein
MANFPNQSKIEATGSVNHIVKDFAHAAKIFRSHNFDLAPKTKFLYHVNFNFNPPAIAALGIEKKLLSVLVKTAELPKYNIQADTLNQYNRKKITQVKVDYQPIQIKFHDDNSNVVQDLWEYYFAYHYADSTTAKFDPIRYAAYSRNAMDDVGGKPAGLYRYGYDTGNLFRFFNSIEIFQMSRQKWSRYVLVNPVILAWSHDSLDYSSSQPAEQTMTVGYEAVGFSNGSGLPDGYPTEKVDQVKSSIGLNPDGTFSTNPEANQVSTKLTTSQPIPTETALKQTNSYQNVNNNIAASMAVKGLTAAIASSVGNLTSPNVTSNLNISFNNVSPSQVTNATQTQL